VVAEVKEDRHKKLSVLGLDPPQTPSRFLSQRYFFSVLLAQFYM
jgi:hypothetical protein